MPIRGMSVQVNKADLKKRERLSLEEKAPGKVSVHVSFSIVIHTGHRRSALKTFSFVAALKCHSSFHIFFYLQCQIFCSVAKKSKFSLNVEKNDLKDKFTDF